MIKRSKSEICIKDFDKHESYFNKLKELDSIKFQINEKNQISGTFSSSNFLFREPPILKFIGDFDEGKKEVCFQMKPTFLFYFSSIILFLIFYPYTIFCVVEDNVQTEWMIFFLALPLIYLIILISSLMVVKNLFFKILSKYYFELKN